MRGEIQFGLVRLPFGKRRTDLESKARTVLKAFACAAIPPVAADHYAALKERQAARGLPLVENDLWIAATALSAALVTKDSDFARLDGFPIVLL